MKHRTLVLFLLLGIVTHISAVVPAGYYYLADGKKQAELKTALNDIVSSGIFLSYGAGVDYTWQGFYHTDRNPLDSTVTDRYSNIIRKQGDYNGVSGMHIEHSLPKSWWGGYVNNAYKDLNHLYPADGLTNSTKNDLPLGEVELPAALLDNGVSKIGKNTFGTDYTGNCFEPADEYKGDFARSYFYVATVYEEFSTLWQSPMMNNNTYPVWKPWAIDLLLKWHREDPVSDLERTRVEEVYNIQGNRNPFIDYPDLVEYIWGNKTNETYTFPAETEPFLVTPNRWTTIDFGVIMQNDAKRQTLNVQGINLTSNVTLALKSNKPGLSISQSTLIPDGKTLSTTIFVDCNASVVGQTIDTLLITGGGLTKTIAVPIKATVSSDFMVLDATNITATSATLNWINYPNTTNYALDVYTGSAQAGDLFFCGYVEGSTGFNKALAIYNGTGATVDLSKYSLKKQNNGFGLFETETPLVGTLVNGAVYVVAHLGAGTDIANQANLKLGTSTTDQNTVVSFNGNDAVALYHSGLQIDVMGEVDNPNDWGKDVTLQRKTTVTSPSTQFAWSEWTNKGTDVYANFNVHTATFSNETYVKQNMTVNAATSFSVSELTPETEYSYRIKAVEPNVSSANCIRFKTKALEAPLALNASIIHDTSFEAEWEEVPGATNYLLDVYQLAGTGVKASEEGFSNIDSCKTAGWNFGSTGTYTSASYVGKSAPAISFSATGHTVTTPTYEGQITELTFMYRYPTVVEAAIGSIFAIDGYNGTTWVNIDSLKNTGSTTKNYPNYTFTAAQNFTALRFVYALKKSGNVSLDDISITYGQLDTTYLIHNESVAGAHYMVTNAEAQSDYYYRVRSAVGTYTSPYSNEIKVTTDMSNTTPISNLSGIELFSTPAGIHLVGLTEETTITLYNLSGICMYQAQHVSNRHFIPITQKGIFIIQAEAGNNTEVFKVIK